MKQRSCIVPVLLLALCLAPAHAAAAADVPASAQAGAHAAAFARLILIDGKPRWKESRGGYALLSYEDGRLVAEIGTHGSVANYVYNWERLVGIRYEDGTTVLAQYDRQGRLARLKSCLGKGVSFQYTGSSTIGVSPTSARAGEFHHALAQLAEESDSAVAMGP